MSNQPDPARQQAIRREILEKLDRAHPYALPQPTLRTMLNSAIRPPVSDAEFDDAMSFLQAREFVTTRPDELDPENADLMKWLITEIGQNILHQ